MAVCPVCEHEEPGVECLVCGKRLLDVGGLADPLPQLEGLEATGIGTPPVPDPDRLADLEPTSFEAADPAVSADPATWIEGTAWSTAEVAIVEALDVERTAAAPGDAPGRDPFALPTCRYCGTAAAPDEGFCSRCGLKLATYRTTWPEERPRPARRCRFCGAAGAGGACPSCGARLPAET